MYTAYLGEIYKCIECDKEYDKSKVIKSDTWSCPDCGKPISIKAIMKKKAYCVNRKKPCLVKNGDKFRVDQNNYYVAINCDIDGYDDDDIYRISLKRYTVLTIKREDFVDIIVGEWG